MVPSNLMRVTLLLLVVYGFGQSVDAQTYSVVYKFVGTAKHGAHPQDGLIKDAAGNLYGTTLGGGTARLGTVFKLEPDGSETVLHSFVGSPDGARPNVAALVLGSDGSLYGTTRLGGAFNLGTIFKINPNGNETVLHSFSGGGTDGAQPSGALVRDAMGNLYGTTFFGGVSFESLDTRGTVFKMDPLGNETILHTFCGVECNDGAFPDSGLVQDSAGNLYGTTISGGQPLQGNRGRKSGTIFRITPTGDENVLVDLTQVLGAVGAEPRGPLTLDEQGNLYGTTKRAGSNGAGTVFKYDSNARIFTVLYSFNLSEGINPRGGVVRDAAGNLYGTTATSTASGCRWCGTVFKVDPNGAETVLHKFTGGGDGRRATGPLLVDPEGNVYGTTSLGGFFDSGTIFRIVP